MDDSLSGSSIQGISQARILEWVAVPPPGDVPKLLGNPFDMDVLRAILYLLSGCFCSSLFFSYSLSFFPFGVMFSFSDMLVFLSIFWYQ